MCSMNRQHFPICSFSGKFENTVMKSLVVQAFQSQRDTFLHHTTSVTLSRSFPKIVTPYGFVKFVDLLRY